uniref:Uncharacterized protein n=1 Tax=Neisseria meningitidis alpha275 TaxID=295996 RepID=C6SKJ0_NEIME|nr:hypothetical protein predicted by Glimmer/Critica [Neisseria meningitidis alpha275]
MVQVSVWMDSSFPRKRESGTGNHKNLSGKPKLKNNGNRTDRIPACAGMTAHTSPKKLKPNRWDSLLREADRCRLKDFQTA